ncbi:MAG: hypothetical protein AAF694_27450 [Bacteroidota bacterium]
MNTIQFSLTSSKIEDYLTTAIYIDGIDLKEILAYYEMGQIENRQLQSLVGAYEGISAFIAFHLNSHFLKDTIQEYIQSDYGYTLFEYAYSGIPGEHNVSCHINIHQDTVEWINFKNRSIFLKKCFQYQGLHFCFDRKQYEQAIEEVIENEVKPIYT